MHIAIHARHFSLTQAIRSHVERRLGQALSKRYDPIQRILVRLSCRNRSRGSHSRCCQIQVVIPGQTDVVIEDTESNLYAAIDRAVDRARRTVARRLARARSRVHNAKLMRDASAVMPYGN